MPISSCPFCDGLIDMDGFACGLIFYCECGKILNSDSRFNMTEIPKDQVDLSGLETQYPKDFADMGNHGFFIRKDRIKK